MEVDRFSLGAMLALGGLCLVGGTFPGFIIDALAPVSAGLVGDHMPLQRVQPWLSIVPIGESRSSYNGFLVFLFIAVSASLGAYAIHRLASRRLRRGPAWDCGYPDPSPATQYTASSFAQPLRRVFGSVVFRARERVEMPAPGDISPARFSLSLRDLVWDWFYAPVAEGVGGIAQRLNRFQFLTIRQYLSLVFVALIGLLSLVALWP